MRARTWASAAAITLVAAAAAAPQALAVKRGTASRHHAGVRWDFIPTRATGAEAVLQLDRALVPDRRRGGFVDQLLWVQTNHPNARHPADVAYGGKRRVPFIAAGITKGRAARPSAFVAQRNQDGAYFQTTVPAPVALGRPTGVVIMCDGPSGCDPKNDKGGDDAWRVRFQDLPEREISVKNAGPGAGSAAFYVGLEATSRDALAGGQVSGLGYRVGGALGTMGYDSWQPLDDRFKGPTPSTRSGGTARWTSKNKAFTNTLR